jgi:hypothetical protein
VTSTKVRVTDAIHGDRVVVGHRHRFDRIENLEEPGRTPGTPLERGGDGEELRVSSERRWQPRVLLAGVDDETAPDDTVVPGVGVAEVVERQVSVFGPLGLELGERP